MDKRTLTSLYGLITACEWDHHGQPTRVKLSTKDERDYFVTENEIGLRLLDHLKTWVWVRGILDRQGSVDTIEIETFDNDSKGGFI
ncbi:MAG: hypothetical protein KDD33_11085 [Bdellovibrionales bacterium]|nr:hypothetical protein [Bdellovibrionales bacterium]